MAHLRLSMEIWPNMPWGRLELCGPAWNSWGNTPLHELIHKIKGYGYEGFDVVYPKIQGIPEDEYQSEVQLVRKAMQETGIEFASIGCHTTLVSPREFDRRNGIAKFKAAIDAAADMDCKQVTTLVGDGFYDPPLYILMPHREAWRQVVEATKELCDYAQSKKINVCIELIQGTVINSIDALCRLFDDVDRPNLYCCVDVGTFYTTVKPKMAIPAAIEKIADRIRTVHVKDEVGFPNIMQSQHVWYGAGFVDFKEMAQALKDAGFSGCAAVEWEGFQNGGLYGVGDPSGMQFCDFDRVAQEAREFLLENGWD